MTILILCSFNFDNMIDGLYIAPAFMDKIVVHIAKNFMDLPNIKVNFASPCLFFLFFFPSMSVAVGVCLFAPNIGKFFLQIWLNHFWL